jgi:hypothetical protein
MQKVHRLQVRHAALTELFEGIDRSAVVAKARGHQLPGIGHAGAIILRY